jgi:hypothetical protein
VCDNTQETDIGAPYYSDQQLFPGFMMAEYDGSDSLLRPRHFSVSFPLLLLRNNSDALAAECFWVQSGTIELTLSRR